MFEREEGFDAARIEAGLRRPLVSREEGVFRLGLVLNGTASSAAWTAGALDFLVEALDLWEDRKRQDRERGDGRPTVPDHELRVGIAGGTSGGGLCAALLARAAGWSFPHAADADAPANNANPFWRVLVEELDIAPMLDSSDLAPPGSAPLSLLAGAAMEAAGGVVAAWPGGDGAAGGPCRPRRRAWLADPFRVVLTLTNLRGVPYRIWFGPGGGDGRDRPCHQVDHADHALFAFPAADGAPDAAALGLRGDEHLVRDAAGWGRFAEFAKAAAASPGVFPARRLSRPVADYEWRGVVLPGGGGQEPRVEPRRPAWDALDAPPAAGPGSPYRFDGVDGGALDGQAVELVRTALCGLGGSNPRDPKEAHTSVLLLDPCAGAAPGRGPALPPPTGDDDRPRDLLGVLGGVAAAWTERGRFSTPDLLLALEPGVASRFLLAARRERDGKPRHGAEALATAGMGGLLGLLRRELRAHDYMVGRENCRAFLMHGFALHEDNPVFRGFAARCPDAADEYRPHPGRRGWLPVVPVVEHLRVPRLLPEWPRDVALDPGRLAGPLEDRFAPLLRRLLGGDDGPGGAPADGAAARRLAGEAAARVREALEGGALG